MAHKGPDDDDVDIKDIWKFLHEMDKSLKSHLIEEAIYRPKLLELIEVLEKSKGAVLVFKALFYIGAPVAAFIYWVKDHVKL